MLVTYTPTDIPSEDSIHNTKQPRVCDTMDGHSGMSDSDGDKSSVLEYESDQDEDDCHGLLLEHLLYDDDCSSK